MFSRYRNVTIYAGNEQIFITPRADRRKKKFTDPDLAQQNHHNKQSTGWSQKTNKESGQHILEDLGRLIQFHIPSYYVQKLKDKSFMKNVSNNNDCFIYKRLYSSDNDEQGFKKFNVARKSKLVIKQRKCDTRLGPPPFEISDGEIHLCVTQTI